MTTDTNHAESIADDRRLAACIDAENAEIAADLQRMDSDIAYRTAVYREWREQRGQLQRSKRLHELAEERIEQLEAELAKTVPPVVGHRFRRRNGTTDDVVTCVMRSCYVGQAGMGYTQTGRADAWRGDAFDLIEDLGSAGGEA